MLQIDCGAVPQIALNVIKSSNFLRILYSRVFCIACQHVQSTLVHYQL